jgi:hypothetical protein
VGLDKRRFREIEALSRAHPAGYTPLISVPVRSLAEFEAAVLRLGGMAFVKPANEGNSRGCQVVAELSQCRVVWASLAPYHDTGVMVEALVRDAREYSWDFAGGFRWLTEKHTTQDRFRAEIQQIVPAPLTPQQAHMLDAAGQHVRQLVSARNGAFHNELFLQPNGVAAVETNMRPAGMHIWDLATLAFEDFDPWREWLRWSVTGELCHANPVPRAVSGIRMLRPPVDGVLVSVPDVSALAASLEIPVHQSAIVRPAGHVSAEVTDNGGFLGQIMLVADDSATLLDRLDRLAAAIETSIVVEPHAGPIEAAAHGAGVLRTAEQGR